MIRRRVPAAILLLASFVVTATSARAGAWLREPGGWYLRTSWLTQSTTTRSDCDGDPAAVDAFGGRYREHLLFTYVEWGAHASWTLIGSYGVKDARVVDAEVPDYGTRSTTDLRLGARTALLRGAWPLSIEVQAAIPTYPRTDPRAPVSSREQFLPVGSGYVEPEVHLLLGRSGHPLPVYFNLDVGYRRRSGEFGDQWAVNVETGGTFGPLFLKSELRGILPTGDPCGSAAAGAVTFHERIWRWNAETAWALRPHLWLGVGAAVPFAGRNALDGVQWAVSLAWQHTPRARGPGR